MPRQHGVTLLELLVVLTIIGFVSTLVTLSLRDTSQQLVEQEAQRLASQLEAARVQARSNGVPMVWRPTPDGFVFESPRGFQPLPSPQRWLAAQTQATIQAGSEPATQVVLGPEPLLVPVSITLRTPANSGALAPHARIATDGLRPFQMEP